MAVSSELLLTSLWSPNLVFVASSRELSLVHYFPNSPKEKNYLGAFVKPTISQISPLESLIELILRWDAMYVTSISGASYQKNMGYTAFSGAGVNIFYFNICVLGKICN